MCLYFSFKRNLLMVVDVCNVTVREAMAILLLLRVKVDWLHYIFYYRGFPKASLTLLVYFSPKPADVYREVNCF